MRTKILYSLLFAIFLTIAVCGYVMRDMWIYGVGILALAIWGAMLNILFVHKRIDKESEKQTAALKEAGAALTSTLKILFDNLKKLNTEKTRLQGKLADLNTRIHNIEQRQRRPEAVLSKQLEKLSQRKLSNEGTSTRSPSTADRDRPSPPRIKYTDTINTSDQP